MARPRLFLHIKDPSLDQRLRSLPVVSKFSLIPSSGDPDWPTQMVTAKPAVALVEMNQLCDTERQQLRRLHPFQRLDYIILSQGSPNPDIDNQLLHHAGFHFRAPYCLQHIEATLQDFYHRGQRDQAVSEQILHSELEQFGLLVGSSQSMRELYQTIRKVADSAAHVLVSGESGAGKELVANTIHSASARADKPFIALNCGALSPDLIDSELFGHVKGSFTGALRDHKGVFEQADGGTLFLDEITEMPLEQQVKLLRVLESGEYRKVGGSGAQLANVRVIAATNREVQDAVEHGFLRQDLYFRLAQFPIRVPALRERGEDIEGLAKHFLAYRNACEGTAKSITPAALAQIGRYHWPGNVRELKHTLERAYILADNVIEPSHIALDGGTKPCVLAMPSGMPLKELEAAAIQQTLLRNQGNKTSSAEQLGISVKTLYNKLEKYQS
ncbi:sigma-54 interaction domain-containing protein [Aliidiomarina soli]|uniref:Sigma-54-dependent Fis family transcriptional regulator n=1 Tax=Aliidiomarina soli TaxID=1928574 RepID=A0A432WII5_9GAMM|nr:sigma-54 dependent transcriptional regulator [Aliidiomarina soli]RUO33624.1 sigma-54-dependent Fis family transcriptional regulator [Aliidiomarina soli]